jgi:lysophospholipase L1-like esterase
LLACLFLAACGQSGRLTLTDSRSTILAFGDSLTHGTGVAASQSYPTVLDGLVKTKVIRSGIPGEISANNGLKRLKGELDRHQPDLVILCHGGNDILRRLPGETTRQNLAAMVNLIRSSGAEVLLIAVPNISLFPKAAS